jgi:uncharacterized protein involved in response to NO
MLNIDDPLKTENTPAIWRLGFRPFFLGGAVLASLYIPLWLMGWFVPAYSLFNGDIWHNVAPIWWHPHELLFGFAMAIVCGFLLTAVQAWTNRPTLTGTGLALVFGCWCMARVLLLLPLSIPLFLPALFDSLFLGASAITLWRCIYPVKQWRNIGFPIMLTLALLVNLLSYYALANNDFVLANHIWQAMIWWLALLITIVGGRVIPFFTAMRLQTPKPDPIEALDITLILVMIALVFQAISQLLPQGVEQGLLLSAGVLQLWRFSRWQPLKTLKEPMLWSLHLSYLALPATLFALAWFVGDVYVSKILLHLFAIGCLAALCLSMISRVSLGHTSRNIYQGPNMILAFVCLPLAAVLRAVMPLLFPQWTQIWLWLAGIAWFIAFAMFVWHYARILTQPRVDGRPG